MQINPKAKQPIFPMTPDRLSRLKNYASANIETSCASGACVLDLIAEIERLQAELATAYNPALRRGWSLRGRFTSD